MKTRKLRIKRKVVVKSRKKGKLNRKISIRRKHRKSIVRRRTRQNKYRRHNLKKKFSRKMRGGNVIEKTQDFYKSYGLGWKNASFTVTYDTSSKIMIIKWDSNTYPDGFQINFNEENIIVDGNTVKAVGSGGDRKIVKLYSNGTANQFKEFLDSVIKISDETTGEDEIRADDLIKAIGTELYADPEYESYKKIYNDNTRLARSPEIRQLFIKIARSLRLIINLTHTQNETIKIEIVRELSKYIGNSNRLISTVPESTFWSRQGLSMSLPELLYYKWENDIYEQTVRALSLT